MDTKKEDAFKYIELGLDGSFVNNTRNGRKIITKHGAYCECYEKQKLVGKKNYNEAFNWLLGGENNES